MSAMQTFVRIVPIALILLAGCDDFTGWRTEQAPGPVVAEQKPESSPPAEEVSDPHQEETIEQVLEFVGRLNQASEPTEQPAPPQEPAVVSAAEHQPVRATALVNRPLDVNDAADPVGEAPQPPPPPQPAMPVIESVFILTPLGADLAEAGPETTQTTNSPLSATDPPPSQVSLEELIAALGKRAEEHPEDTVAQWELRLLRLAVGDDQAARKPPGDTSGEYAELLGKLIEAIIATRDALESPLTASAAALEAVEALEVPLRERSDLQIPTVALCTRVQTFGVYDQMPGSALLANRANRAIVYTEIGNFLSEKTTDGRHRTVLSNELEVLTPDGRSVWRREEPNIVDLSRRRRHDFFLAQMITLPETLGPGEYVLKVSVQDELSGKSNQAVHRFSIGSSSVAQGLR